MKKKNEDCDALYDYPAHLLYNQIMAAIHLVDLEFCVKTLFLDIMSPSQTTSETETPEQVQLHRENTGAIWRSSFSVPSVLPTATLLSKLSGCDFVHEIKAGGARLGGCSGPIHL